MSRKKRTPRAGKKKGKKTPRKWYVGGSQL